MPETRHPERRHVGCHGVRQGSVFYQVSEHLAEHREELKALAGVATAEDHIANAVDDEVAVVERNTSGTQLEPVQACTNAEEIIRFQWLVRQVPVSAQITRRAVEMVRATRPAEADAPEAVRRYVRFGASVRATQFLSLAAKARALMQNRYHVTEEDLRALALPVLRHRMLTNYQAESDGMSVDAVLKDVIGR